MQVRDGRSVVHAGAGHGHGLEAVSQNDNDVRREALQCLAVSDKPQPHGFVDACRGVGAEEHLHLFVGLKTVLLDFGQGGAELRREMHACDEDLKMESMILVDAVHQRFQESVLGPGSGKNTNFPFHDAHPVRLGSL